MKLHKMIQYIIIKLLGLSVEAYTMLKNEAEARAILDELEKPNEVFTQEAKDKIERIERSHPHAEYVAPNIAPIAALSFQRYVFDINSPHVIWAQYISDDGTDYTIPININSLIDIARTSLATIERIQHEAEYDDYERSDRGDPCPTLH